MRTDQCDLSVVIPAFNEAESLAPLVRAVHEALDGSSLSWELVVVDDGSTDATRAVLGSLLASDPRLAVVRLRRNSGQTAALDAGLRQARGGTVATMDADLQNDPADIPRLLTLLGQGEVDVVCGWRRHRRDGLSKRLASRIGNLLRRLLTRERIHDSGCTLRAYRRECLEGLELYGDMHRFIPAVLALRGFRVGEIEVNHHPRRCGRSKYGSWRLVRGFLDLLVVAFWLQYRTRPIHLFGGLGVLLFGTGSAIVGVLTVLRLLHRTALADRPLLLLAVMLVLVGLQLLTFGLIADVLLKIYNRGVPTYSIAEVRRGRPPDGGPSRAS